MSQFTLASSFAYSAWSSSLVWRLRLPCIAKAVFVSRRSRSRIDSVLSARAVAVRRTRATRASSPQPSASAMAIMLSAPSWMRSLNSSGSAGRASTSAWPFSSTHAASALVDRLRQRFNLAVAEARDLLVLALALQADGDAAVGHRIRERADAREHFGAEDVIVGRHVRVAEAAGYRHARAVALIENRAEALVAVRGAGVEDRVRLVQQHRRHVRVDVAEGNRLGREGAGPRLRDKLGEQEEQLRLAALLLWLVTERYAVWFSASFRAAARTRCAWTTHKAVMSRSSSERMT